MSEAGRGGVGRGTRALEAWARRATQGYSGVTVTNMTTAWRDGLAFCALIHSYRPDLIEFSSLVAGNVLENNALAFRVAEQQLGIPALLDAQDMLDHPVPDRLSVLTYVSQFYQTFSGAGLPNCVRPQQSQVEGSREPGQDAPRADPTPAKADKVVGGGGWGWRRGARERCGGCGDAVYLAERLVVGTPGQVRHRTCFQCARCSSQLTLASYYQTQRGDFCCETCPDEETRPDQPHDPAMGGPLPPDTSSESGDSESEEESGENSTAPSPAPSPTPSPAPSPAPPKPRTVFLTQTLREAAPEDPPPLPLTPAPTHTTSGGTDPPSQSHLSPALFGSQDTTGPKADRTSPGQVRPSPRQGRTSPGLPRTSPSQTRTGPGQTRTSPGQVKRSHGQDKLVLGRERLEAKKVDRLDHEQDKSVARPLSIVAQRLKLFQNLDQRTIDRPTDGSRQLKKARVDTKLMEVDHSTDDDKLMEVAKRSDDDKIMLGRGGVDKKAMIGRHSVNGKAVIGRRGVYGKAIFGRGSDDDKLGAAEVDKRSDEEKWMEVDRGGTTHNKRDREGGTEKEEDRVEEEEGGRDRKEEEGEIAKEEKEGERDGKERESENKEGEKDKGGEEATSQPQHNISFISVTSDHVDSVTAPTSDDSITREPDEPIMRGTDEPIMRGTDEPVMRGTDEPIMRGTDEPIMRGTDEPIARETDEPIARETDEPIARETDEPITRETDEPIARETDEPITRETDEPITRETDKPIRREYNPFDEEEDESQHGDSCLTVSDDSALGSGRPDGQSEEDSGSVTGGDDSGMTGSHDTSATVMSSADKDHHRGVEHVVPELVVPEHVVPEHPVATPELKTTEHIETQGVDGSSSSREEPPVLSVQYPDGLNPFGSEDESEPETGAKKEPTRRLIKVTLNPFGSDDDNEDDGGGGGGGGDEEKDGRKNLNPFWSEEEEGGGGVGGGGGEDGTTRSGKKVKPPRPPPPTLRRNSATTPTYPLSPGPPPTPPIGTPRKKSLAPPRPPPSPPSPARLSPAPSASPTGSLALRKKGRKAPHPPQGHTPPSPSHHHPKEGEDEVLGWKLQKDLKNRTNKLNTTTAATTTTTDTATAAAHPPPKPARCLPASVESPSLPGGKKCDGGEWQRRKGPAPPRPVPQKRALKKLPMRIVQQELADIDIKQTELERQGVILETAIRKRTEEEEQVEEGSGPSSIEVEDMILQLFELVNEKNELFRRQTELMYMKREKRLEEEHVELEFQIRCLMLKAPADRTSDDTATEERLIRRLVSVVEQRDQIINCLELDRLREAQEDQSIATHMMEWQEKHIDGVENGCVNPPPTTTTTTTTTTKKKKTLKLPRKKNKNKEKERKGKKKNGGDADKDVDESESVDKKKKKKWLF